MVIKTKSILFYICCSMFILCCSKDKAPVEHLQNDTIANNRDTINKNNKGHREIDYPTDWKPDSLRETIRFKGRLRGCVDMRKEIAAGHGHETMELTDSLKRRMRLFAEHDANYIVRMMLNRDGFTKDIPIDDDDLWYERYIFSKDDKAVIAEFLYRNTSFYNDIGTHFRYERYQGKWPY